MIGLELNSSIGYLSCPRDSLSVAIMSSGLSNSKALHNAWLSSVTDQQLMICACSVIAVQAQIVSGWSVTDDNHTSFGTESRSKPSEDDKGFCFTH